MENSGTNILLVEDNPGDARLVTEMLKDSDLLFTLTHASRLEEALKFLNNERFDITLLDIELPDSHGLSGLEKIIAHGPGMPVLVLTGMDDENLGMQAVQKNAEDYIVKGHIKPNSLVRSIRYAFERRRGQREREITIEFLRIVNECAGMRDLIRAVAIFFQKQSGCRSVGIRLREGDDYPYFETLGFPEDFVKTENSLCRRDSSGKPVLDGNSSPIFECMCGNVICGRFDPSKPFFTAHGSFWTNSTTQSLASQTWNAEHGTRSNREGGQDEGFNSSSVPDSEFQVPSLSGRTRNRCNGEGYESVALIPLKTGKERFGLLQLNDRRKGVFPPELISLWERLADHLAVTLAKFRAEQALRENEERYRGLVEMSPEAVFINSDNKITYVNQAALNLFGASSPEELLGKSPFDLYHPDYHPLMRERIKHLMEGHSVPLVETKGVRLDGKIIDVEVAASPFLEKGVRAIQVLVRDITARKKMQETVERYHLISRYARDPLLLIDLDGKIVEGNEAAVEFYGYTREELLQLNILRLRRREEAGTVRRQMMQARSGGILFESVHIQKDGTSVPVEVSSRGVFIEGREMLLSVVRDITERKKRDAELQRLNRTLKAQSQSNQTMMRARDESDYMKEVCEIIVRTCGHAMVWIGFAENDEDKSVRPAASAGYEDGYLEKLKITWADTELGHGPTGTAIRTGKPSMCRNMLTDPAFKPWREQAINCGYASSIGFPLTAEGRAFGAITIYSREPDPFTEDEVKLLSELADDLAYGITAIRLRAALHKSEQNANAILNAITESIWLVDSEGRILAANSIAAERMGLRISEIGGKNYFDLLPPHLAEPRRIQAKKVFRSGNPLRFEDEKSGTAFDHSIYPVRNEKGNITGLAIFSSDITARKWAENRLVHQRAMLEAVIESSDGPVFSVDRNYCYTIFNSQHRKEMKSLFDADIRKGCNVLDYYTSPDDIVPVKENIDMAFRGEHVFVEAYTGEEALTRRYFGTSYNPIRDPGGTVTGVAIFARDFTYRKKAEDILKRDKKTLQKLVRERSAKLMEIQTEMERSKSLSDIGTLAATVAHELRNPLAGINLATAIIKRKSADNIIEQQLQGIDKMVEESGQIIDNLLSYSRLKLPQRKNLNAHSLLEECTSTLQHVRVKKNIVISKHIDSLEDVPISADPVQIREVFTNILNNAADAVPDSGGEMDVRARVYHDLIRIHITDNGHGMAKEDLKKVFEPFFTTKAKGTGLGLTVCRQIVKMHGGFINIKSRKGKGTSVIITLPREEPGGG